MTSKIDYYHDRRMRLERGRKYMSIDAMYDWWKYVLRFCERQGETAPPYIYDERSEKMFFLDTFEGFVDYARIIKRRFIR